MTVWENGDGGWRITTIVADHNHDGTESYVPEDVQLVQRVENVKTITLLVQDERDPSRFEYEERFRSA
jgi:hypothetical protein